jgi:hypothetical protein
MSYFRGFLDFNWTAYARKSIIYQSYARILSKKRLIKIIHILSDIRYILLLSNMFLLYDNSRKTYYFPDLFRFFNAVICNSLKKAFTLSLPLNKLKR